MGAMSFAKVTCPGACAPSRAEGVSTPIVTTPAATIKQAAFTRRCPPTTPRIVIIPHLRVRRLRVTSFRRYVLCRVRQYPAAPQLYPGALVVLFHNFVNYLMEPRHVCPGER